MNGNENRSAIGLSPKTDSKNHKLELCMESIDFHKFAINKYVLLTKRRRNTKPIKVKLHHHHHTTCRDELPKL